MRLLNNIRYILFGLMVLGCFANFAQNEYGLSLLYFCEFSIGLIFLIEAFIYARANTGGRAIYLFCEHFILGVLFMAFSMGHHLWSFFPRVTVVFCLLFLFLLYIAFAVRTLIKEPKKSVLMAILIFLFSLASIVAVFGLSFKLVHWPGANKMMQYVSFAAIFFGILYFIKVKYPYGDERISFKERIKRLPGKMPLVFCYFSIWCLYVTMAIYGLVPGFYTLTNPPAVEKLKQQNSERAGVYWQNFETFFENRRTAGEN